MFDSAVDATVELIFCTSAGGVPHQQQLPLAQRLVHAVRLAAPAAQHLINVHLDMRVMALHLHSLSTTKSAAGIIVDLHMHSLSTTKSAVQPSWHCIQQISRV